MLSRTSALRHSGLAQLRKELLKTNQISNGVAKLSTFSVARNASSQIIPALRQVGQSSQRHIVPMMQVTVFKRFYADFPKHVKVPMPALSPTMNQGNIGKWAKKVGDQITPGDVLVEIETDKATMDFECQEEGFLAKILIPTGTKDVPINALIAILAEKKDDIPKFESYSASAAPVAAAAPIKKEAPAPVAAAPSTPAAAATQVAQAQTSGDRQFISPAAKKLAEEKGVNLSLIQGTGPNTRVVLADVERFIASGAKAPAPAQVQAPVAVAPQKVSPLAAATEAAFTDIPLNNIRKVIATRLTQAKQSIPHYYLTVDINVDKLLKIRGELNKKSETVKLSVNDFVIKAAAKSLLKVPEVNSSWMTNPSNENFIRQFHNADISVAVATPTGLITPIVFSAEAKGLSDISHSVKELSSRAKEGKLKPNEYQGGSFSISNLGMFGIKSFTAIINPPQSCILAVGTTTKTLIPLDTPPSSSPSSSSPSPAFTTANLMSVTLSCDHRVVDGAVGAQWLQVFKGYMEDPITMLL